MCNAANNILIISGLAVALCNCTGGANDEKQARMLLEAATRQLQHNMPDSALSMLDSLDKKYPSQVRIRREAMPLRAKAITASLENKIFETDSLIIVYQTEVDKLMPLFDHSDVSGANGYYYMKGAYGPNLNMSDGVQARLSDIDFSYYIVAANTGNKIGINQITLSSPTGSVSSAVIPESDGRRGDTDKYGTDFATFSPSESDTIGAWAFNNSNNIQSVTISGDLGSKEFSLSGPKAEQFGNTWRLGVVGAKLSKARRLKEKLDRQIIIARDHNVNLAPPTEEIR